MNQNEERILVRKIQTAIGEIYRSSIDDEMAAGVIAANLVAGTFNGAIRAGVKIESLVSLVATIVAAFAHSLSGYDCGFCKEGFCDEVVLRERLKEAFTKAFDEVCYDGEASETLVAGSSKLVN